MTVLITRALADAQQTAALLHLQQINTLIDPLIAVEFLKSTLDVSGFDDVIFTSKNGVRSFCQNYNHRHATAWCVGDKTANLAQESGFETVYSAHGNADNLAVLITQKTSKKPMLRINQNQNKDPLFDHLTSYGYTLQLLTLYRIIEQTSFSQKTIQALKEKNIQHLLCYSPKSAELLHKNLVASNLQDACSMITVWCISKGTANALGDLEFNDIIIAENPNEEALLTPLIARVKNDRTRSKKTKT